MKTLAERFWAKVDKTGECWLWTGAIGDVGYGNFYVGGGRRAPIHKRAHVVAWELEHGPVPPGFCVLHECDNRRCVRHLFLGTKAENSADMVEKRRSATGLRNGGAKLSDLQVRAIRSVTGTQAEIAARYGVSQSLVSLIRLGKIHRLVED